MAVKIPRGCEICLRGAKLVLFVTGMCGKSCFYCPLSERRKGVDAIFADEVEVEKDLDVILEARAIDAEGTGVTGGDPILRVPRVVKYVRMLKGFFGEDHHVHLYTNGRHVTKEVLQRLKEAGVDEMRFHPDRRDWHKIAMAKEAGFAAGAEMPAIPGGERHLMELVEYLSAIKADFLNLNQLEFCPQNAHQMKQRGFALEKGGLASVDGSQGAAMLVLRWASEGGIELPIHYCSSSVKDAIQTRMRLVRRGKNVAKPYEAMDNDGVISKLAVDTETGGHSKASAKALARETGVQPWAVGVSRTGSCLEAESCMGDAIRRVLPHSTLSVVKEYPTALRERFRVFSA
jgi:pyruvate formate-lyase activating enzyme-like uncharacterized protein